MKIMMIATVSKFTDWSLTGGPEGKTNRAYNGRPEVNHVSIADYVCAETVSSIPVAYEPQSCSVTIRKGRTETESDSLAL